MKCEQVQELITGLVDNELSDLERSTIESHLEECPTCEWAYEQERALKREIRKVGATVVAPAGLRKKILSDQRIFPKETESPKRWTKLVLPLQPFRRPVFGLALLVILVILSLYFMQPSSQPISLAALRLQEKIIRGEVHVREARSQQELNNWLSRAVDSQFGPIVYDFSSMNVKPVGGLVQEVKGRQMLVAVFRGNSLYVSCFTFLGTEEDAPKNATVFFDRDKKMKFYIFSTDGIHAVLHREGNVICILVSNMPPEELLSLVRGSSPHSHIRVPLESKL
jgi:anti-sigma factor (TIGR02949 family)